MNQHVKYVGEHLEIPQIRSTLGYIGNISALTLLIGLCLLYVLLVILHSHCIGLSFYLYIVQFYLVSLSNMYMFIVTDLSAYKWLVPFAANI